MAEETQPLQPQQAPPAQAQQAPPQNAIMAVGGNLKNAALNVLKEVRQLPRAILKLAIRSDGCEWRNSEETMDGNGRSQLLCETRKFGRSRQLLANVYYSQLTTSIP